MKAILVFIDGTICDTRPRHRLMGTPDFHKDEEILKDLPVPGSVQCLQELTRQSKIVYKKMLCLRKSVQTDRMIEHQVKGRDGT